MENILLYYIGYVTVIYVRYVRINSVNPLYLIICKINRYIEESKWNKCLTLVPNDESKDKLKKPAELCAKIRDLIKSKAKNAAEKKMWKLILIQPIIYLQRKYLNGINLNNIAILNICGVNYGCIINVIEKSEAVNLLQNADWTEKRRTL